MPLPEVVLHVRPGCHLCADARAVLDGLAASEPFAVREVDIESDDALHARYLERIPVVVVDGREVCDLVVDPAAVLAAVRAVPRIDSEAMTSIDASPPAPLDGTDAPSPDARLGVGQAERLSRYLQVLTQARKTGRATMSSQELSDHTHVNSTQIRRDLSGFGRFGKRGVGYDVEELVGRIGAILHTGRHVGILLLGAGHLGRAIAASDVFGDHGFEVLAVLDNDPAKIGTPIGDLGIGDVRHIADVVREHDIVVGVIAAPAKAAQGLADELVEAGVQIIFNYSGALLRTPPEVTVHTSSPAVDLLHALYYYLA